MPRVTSISCKGKLEISIAINAICKQRKNFYRCERSVFLNNCYTSKKKMSDIPPSPFRKQISETSEYFVLPSQIRLVTMHDAI